MSSDWDVAVRCRRVFCSFAAVALIVGAPAIGLAEEGARWWPFGGGAKTEDSLPEVTDAPPVADPPQYLDEPTDSDSGWPNVHLPEIRWRPLWSRQGDPQQGVFNGPVNRVRAAGRNTVQATRGAWNTTVDKFRWGGTAAREEQFARRQQQLQQQRQQAASEQQQPGFWDRLFGNEPAEPEGPRTVVEWMAQDRPGMNK